MGSDYGVGSPESRVRVRMKEEEQEKVVRSDDLTMEVDLPPGVCFWEARALLRADPCSPSRTPRPRNLG